MESNPDRLVEIHRERRDFWVLDLLQQWVLSKRLRRNSKRFAYSSVRSFFMHNRAPLPVDRSFRVKGDLPKVAGTLTLEELSMLLSGVNVLYRAVFLSMFQGGMGAAALVYWSETGFESLVDKLDRGVHPVRVDLPGRKRVRNERTFYTFLGRDAVEALRKWLGKRGREPGAIFINQYGHAVTKTALRRYWRLHLRRLGLIARPKRVDTSIRYGKNQHEMRDLFRSRWQKSAAAGEATEFFMGHVIDPNEYNKAFRDKDYAAEQYLRAEPWLNILSEDPEVVPVRGHRRLQREILELRKAVKEAE